MSQTDNDRAQRKAQTRLHLRQVAQQLFAERGFDAVTVDDIAQAAGFSAQTLFNHFTSKEELFFDGRTDWVEAPAAAVRSRRAAVSPLLALQEHLIAVTVQAIQFEASAEGRALVQAIAASPTLARYESRLVHQAEHHLRDALAEVWQEPDQPPAIPLPLDIRARSTVYAATLLAAARAVIVSQRSHNGTAADWRGPIPALVARILLSLDESLRSTLRLPAGAA